VGHFAVVTFRFGDARLGIGPGRRKTAGAVTEGRRLTSAERGLTEADGDRETVFRRTEGDF
jgi:hypothetical protein